MCCANMSVVHGCSQDDMRFQMKAAVEISKLELDSNTLQALLNMHAYLLI